VPSTELCLALICVEHGRNCAARASARSLFWGVGFLHRKIESEIEIERERASKREIHRDRERQAAEATSSASARSLFFFFFFITIKPRVERYKSL